MANFRIDTKLNPADDPSRDVKLREPEPPEDYMRIPLAPQEVQEPDQTQVPIEARGFQEAYAGRGGLSAAVKRTGVPVFPPLEAYPAKHVYVQLAD